MNALIPSSIDGEIIPPQATVRVVGKTHPLNGGRIDCYVRAGSTIFEILMEALSARPGMVLSRSFVVHVDGDVIPEAMWNRVRVKLGATVTFTPRLQDGAGLRSALGVVVALAALVIAPYLAPGIVSGLAAIGITASVATATALAAGGIILAGSLALNALFPVAAPSLSNESAASLNSIQGAQNQASPFGTIPAVLGRHRQSPFYAAKPYTEIVGDDQFLRLLFCWGYGPQQIHEDTLKIGETPLSSYADIEIQHRQGFPDDPPITLYPASVDEVPLSIELSEPYTPLGPELAWVSQTTAVDTDWFSVDITAPEGMYRINQESGNADAYAVYIDVRWRLAGTEDWTTIYGAMNFSRSTGPSRRGFQTNAARGQYEVQVRKATLDANNDRIKDKVVWTAIRSGKNAAPISFPKPLALTAIRIRATDQLSGSINTFNGETTSLVKSYSGAGEIWNDNTASENCADLFRYVLQSPANARPRTDAQVDIVGLQDWWVFCRDNGFTYERVLTDKRAVFDRLKEIAAAGRAVVTFVDGKWGVIWDQPGAGMIQHFTPRNSWGFQGQRSYAQQPHGWRAGFINAENGYTADERIVYDDGWDETSATLFEGIEFPGVTDPDLIWKHGRFHIAQSRLRPENISLNVSWEHLVCTRGDKVRVTHDVLMIGLASGRVKSVDGQIVTFDEQVTIEAGKTYGFQFRVPEDVRSVDRAVDDADLDAGDYYSLTLVGDLSLIRPGTLFGFGETERASAFYRVKGIKNQKDLVATLSLVDDAPEIAQADQGEIPPYNPNVTIPADPFTLPPRDLQYQETIEGQGPSVKAVIVLTWQVPRFGNIASFEVQSRDDNAGGPWTRVDSVLLPRTQSEVPLVSAGIWSFRVRCIFINGTVSDWVALDHLALLGLARPPDPVSNLRNTYITGRMHLAWDRPVDPRVVGIEIRKGSSFEAAQIVTDDAVNPWQTVGDDTYWVTSYVTSPFGERIYSDPKQSIEIERSVALENVVVSHDERAEGWSGTFSGSIGIDTNQNYLRTSGGDSFLDRADFLGADNFLDQGAQTGGYYWSRHVVNAGRRAFCRISNDWTATGVPVDDDFLANPDFLAQPDFLKSYLSQFIRVRPVIRISKTGPGNAFAETNMFEPDNAFLAGTNWEPIKIWSPDVYDGWLFQMGMQFEILTDVELDPETIAYLLSWVWTVDVPDRLDSYQNLTIPADGLAISFRPTGEATDAPFNGGLNNEPLPHITPSIRNPVEGDNVTWENLTLSSVRVFVKNGGTAVERDEVNLLVRGY